MYRISDADERILVRVGEHDKIECLNSVLSEKVVSILKTNKILTVGELISCKASLFYEMPGIDALEREKIIIVQHWLFRGAYDSGIY